MEQLSREAASYEKRIENLFKEVEDMISTFYLPYDATSLKAPSGSDPNVSWITPRAKLKKIETKINELIKIVSNHKSYSSQLDELETSFEDLKQEIEDSKNRLRKEIEYYEKLREMKSKKGNYFYIEECNDYLTRTEIEEIINGERPLFYYHGTKLAALEYILLQGGLMPQERILLKEAVKRYKRGNLSRRELMEKFEDYRKKKEESIQMFKEKVKKEIILTNERKKILNDKLEELKNQLNNLEIVKNEEIFNEISKLLRNLKSSKNRIGISISLFKSELKDNFRPPIIVGAIQPPQLNNLLYVYYILNEMVKNNLTEKAKNFLSTFDSFLGSGDLGIIRVNLNSIGFQDLSLKLEQVSPSDINNILEILKSAIDRVKNNLKDMLKESLNIRYDNVEDIVNEIFEIIRINFLWNNTSEVFPDLIKIDEELKSIWKYFDKFRERDKWFVYFGADEPYVSRETFDSIIRYTYEELYEIGNRLVGKKPGIILEFKPSAYNLMLWKEIERASSGTRLIREVGYDIEKKERKLYATNIEYYNNVTRSPIPAAISGKLTYDIITDKKISLAYLNRIYTSEKNILQVKELLKEYGLGNIEVCTFEEQKNRYAKALEALKTTLSNIQKSQ